MIIAHFPIITVTNIFPCCQEGLSATKEGFVDVEDVLALPRFRGYLFKDVESVVRDNDKQRFALRKSLETGRWQIRANQGHTIKVIILVIQSIPVTEMPLRIWNCVIVRNRLSL